MAVRSYWFLAWELFLTYATLCFMEICVPPIKGSSLWTLKISQLSSTEFGSDCGKVDRHRDIVTADTCVMYRRVTTGDVRGWPI